MISALIARLGTTPEMLDVFGDRATLQAMLDVEAALARAEARVGMIPQEAAHAIANACRAENFDPAGLAAAGARAGTLVIPLVAALTEAVRASTPAAAGFVHFGATSQDVIDTGLVLQMRSALGLLLPDLARIARALARLARDHADTIMLGRTLLQPGPPVTFGLKAAGWLVSVEAGYGQVQAAAERALAVQFGGATGTLAALGERGMAVAEALGAELALAVPPLPWHTRREGLAALAAAVGIATGALGKIARDVSLLMQAEVAEAAEPGGPGRGGSSAMPHKRNPVACVVARAAAERAPNLVATLLHAMAQEHERGVGGWQAEWATVPPLFAAAAGAAAAMAETIEGLGVDAQAMSANLDRLQGLVLAERAAVRLAPALGRAEAHRLLEAATARALAQKRHLRAVLLEDEAVAAHLTPEAAAELFRPETYLGSSRAFIARALDLHEDAKRRRGES